jgi:hypothetical protein
MQDTCELQNRPRIANDISLEPPSPLLLRAKPQNRRSLLDVELYLTVHKSFVSFIKYYLRGSDERSELNHRDRAQLYVVHRAPPERNHRDRAQLNLNLANKIYTTSAITIT